MDGEPVGLRASQQWREPFCLELWKEEWGAGPLCEALSREPTPGGLFWAATLGSAFPHMPFNSLDHLRKECTNLVALTVWRREDV